MEEFNVSNASKENIIAEKYQKSSNREIRFYKQKVMKLVTEIKLTEADTLIKNCFSGGDFYLDYDKFFES